MNTFITVIKFEIIYISSFKGCPPSSIIAVKYHFNDLDTIPGDE
jgi:hypothetical protein